MVIVPYMYKSNHLCTRCVMDDSVQGIEFDAQGECNFCKVHDELDKKYPLNEDTPIKLNRIVEAIKKAGKGKKYDCIVGVSGGRDSTYTLYKCVELGLRPLAVHFDNGWNSESAVRNIENACRILKVDLHTHVANWEEFKDLQRSFFFASVPDVEVPTDWIIRSVLFKIAKKFSLRFYVTGGSFRTEGTTPNSWTYQDNRYIKSVHKNFGKIKLRSFPMIGMLSIIRQMVFFRLREIRILYYLPYDEKTVMQTITKELEWNDYGGKHHESTFTNFFQSYYLTRKFNIDKRKLHYSALIRSNQLKREEALVLLNTDPFEGDESTIQYILKKLDYSETEFDEIMKSPNKSFRDYNSYYDFAIKLKWFVRIATRLDIIPAVVYQKYFGFTETDS